ncbi:hypothetical protein OQA88_9729 [Cercophora sp. LCS_1]
MCGRYSLALRPSQVRRLLQDEDLQVDDAPADEGDGAPRQAYNFAPGYNGLVYRADVPAGSGASQPADQPQPPVDESSSSPATTTSTKYKLQAMKWGLIPSWTKRNPDFANTLKTINCRDDSLLSPGGMWASMKGKKRCVVIAQGFYEWVKLGPKEKQPYFVRRKDAGLMMFAGLWDRVRYEDGQEVWSYTIVTTEVCDKLRFLHERMPVVLDVEGVRTWLDPKRGWDKEVSRLMRSWEGELEVYKVKREVGKVGNEDASFVVPLEEGKGSITNWFGKGMGKGGGKLGGGKAEMEVQDDGKVETVKLEELGTPVKGVKRAAEDSPDAGEPLVKKIEVASPVKPPSPVKGRPKISATSNLSKSPAKKKVKVEAGSQKITKFFANSS